MEAFKQMGIKFQFRIAAVYTETQVCRVVAWRAEQQAMTKSDQLAHGRYLGTPKNSQVRRVSNTTFPKCI